MKESYISKARGNRCVLLAGVFVIACLFCIQCTLFISLNEASARDWGEDKGVFALRSKKQIGGEYSNKTASRKESLININLYDIDLDVYDFVATGKVIVPTFKVTYTGNDKKIPELLPEDSYTVVYQRIIAGDEGETYETVVGAVEPGDYRIKVTGVEKKGYKGSITTDFSVYNRNDLMLADTVIEGDKPANEIPPSFIYTGKPIYPHITVTLAGVLLVAGKDYTVWYEKGPADSATGNPCIPVNDGEYIIHVVGKCNYVGETGRLFFIYDSMDLSNFGWKMYGDTTSSNQSRYQYTGKQILIRDKLVFGDNNHGKVLNRKYYTLKYWRFTKQEKLKRVRGGLVKPGEYEVLAYAKKNSPYRGHSYNLDVKVYRETYASVKLNDWYVDYSTISYANDDYNTSRKHARTYILGKRVQVIEKRSFEGCRAKTLVVKTKKLTKKSIKGSLNRSGFTTVRIAVGSRAQNLKYGRIYKNAFSKSNVGKKVTVTIS